MTNSSGRARRHRRRPAPPRPTDAPEQRVVVATVRRSWGTSGALSVTPFADEPERLAPGAAITISGSPTRVTSVRRSGRGLVITVESVNSAEQAEALRGAVIEVDASALPRTPEGTYYHYQIIDCEVQTSGGTSLGTVASILETGSNDVYVIRRQAGGQDLLIPAVSSVIRNVDVEAKRITVDLPEGLE